MTASLLAFHPADCAPWSKKASFAPSLPPFSTFAHIPSTNTARPQPAPKSCDPREHNVSWLDSPDAPMHSADPQPFASELASALESSAASSHLPAESSVAPSWHPTLPSEAQRPAAALFVAQNTASMMCYLWFSTSIGVPRPTSNPSAPSTPSRTRRSPRRHPRSPVAESFSPCDPEMARLQFAPSEQFVSFLGTLLSTTQVSQSVIVLSLHYIYQLKMDNPRIRGQEGSEFRLAVVALMLANKFVDDNTYTNKTWAEVSGISLTEINLMEREFLHGVDNRLYVNLPTYEGWLNLLNGLILAKEREMKYWQRSDGPRSASKTDNLHPHYQPPSKSQRARSSSPLRSLRAPYQFTFAPPPFAQPNPFSLPPVHLVRPGSKRSACDAFSPRTVAQTELNPAKRPLSLDIDVPRTQASPYSASPMEPSPVDSVMYTATPPTAVHTPSAPSAVSYPISAMSSMSIGSAVPPQTRTLAAPYTHDSIRWQSAVPQYLTYNTLASSPMGDQRENVARKTVRRCHQPAPYNMGAEYISRHLPAPLSSQSANASPRDLTVFAQYHNQHHAQNRMPSSFSHSHLLDADRHLAVPHPTLHSNSRDVSPNTLRSSRGIQLAPFANAGPPGVQWGVEHRVAGPYPQPQQAQPGFSSMNWSPPVNRGRRM